MKKGIIFTEQSRAEQSRAEQSRAEQSRAKRRVPCGLFSNEFKYEYDAMRLN